MEKQKNSKWFYIICSILAVMLPIIAGITSGSAGFIVICVLVAVTMACFAFFGALQERSRKLCKQCKRKFTIDDVGYEEVSRRTKRYRHSTGDNFKPEKELQERLFAKIRFTCHCPNCQNEQQFVQEFVVADLYWDGHEKETDVEHNIEKYINTAATGAKNGLRILFSSGVFSVILFVIAAIIF